jgi:hypothetical protein
MILRSERREGPFPRREYPLSGQGALGRSQTEEGGEGCWHPEQRDRDLASCRDRGIARQPFFPRKAIMGALRTGKDDFRALCLGRQSLWKRDLNALVAQ